MASSSPLSMNHPFSMRSSCVLPRFGAFSVEFDEGIAGIAVAMLEQRVSTPLAIMYWRVVPQEEERLGLTSVLLIVGT